MSKIIKLKYTFTYYILCLISTFAFASRINAATFKLINPIATSDFAKLVANFLKWTLSVAGSIALIMLVIGGIMYITSAGDQQKATSAKKMIMVTIGGLMLVLLSYSILVVLNDLLT